MDLRQDVLPVLRPLGGEEESNALKEVIESGWWGKGKKVSELEEKFAKLVGAKHAIAVTSNTHGLDLVLKAKGIEHCDVISPTMSFATSPIERMGSGNMPLISMNSIKASLRLTSRITAFSSSRIKTS